VTTSSIFVSSVQKELAEERRAVKAFVEGDPLLRRFFTVFLFEDLPASDARADAVYLDEVDRCALYVGLFGNEYRLEDAQGVSPTEREFDRATQQGKPRLIFVKGVDDRARHPKMAALVRKAGDQLIRRRFTGTADLTAALYASLVEHLERTGALRTRPFDASACPGATLADVSEEKLRSFLSRARSARRFALAVDTRVVETLQHLDLQHHEQPSHAAILLFGTAPQRFLPTSEVKCLHFHGTEVRKPIPSYQVFKGTVFELADQAVDFVMSKIARRVGTRARGPAAPVEYELPREAVAEAVVNAVAHRDYTSNASVQVMLFQDRLEVWNPGELPPPLTPERLRRPHPSIPRNPLIADPLFLAGYIEKAGTGTLDMIARLREAGLPEPEFRQDGGTFVQALWRDWLTPKALASLGLSERQKKAIDFVRTNARIGNAEYQRLAGVTKATASRDLEALTKAGVLRKVGRTGKGTYYTVHGKGLRKGSKGSSSPEQGKGSQRAQTAQRRPRQGARRDARAHERRRA
jgi:predicted HTH transcriptional regulator